PTPPPPPDPVADDQHAWVRDYVSLVTAMLNSTDTVQEVLDVLITWSTPSEELRSEVAPYVWAESADLDRDGTEEWLMSLPVPERGQSPMWFPAHLVIYEVREEVFVPTFVIRGAPPDEVQAVSPELRLIDDITADGQTEVLIEQRWCGAHTCFTGLTVGRYDGTTWHDLAADPISQAYTDLTIEDRDGDGALEFIMHGGIIGSVGAGLQRERTLIFAWEDGAYRLVQELPDPSDHPYYLMLDANTALAEGDWERALELAAQAVDEPDFEGSMVPVEDVDRQRIISYAAVQAMLVHAHRGDAAQMEALLDQVLGYDFMEPNVYTEAAERLIATFRDTGDVLEACIAMEAVVAQQPDDAIFFQWYGYNTTRIIVDQVCPLDGPTDDESPQL
ncbi:MAG: tetratricopeptide repeat protein, partial [Chloroflexota bacterium]